MSTLFAMVFVLYMYVRACMYGGVVGACVHVCAGICFHLSASYCLMALRATSKDGMLVFVIINDELYLNDISMEIASVFP